MDQMFFGVENAKNHEEFRRKVKVFHRIVLLTLFVFCISTILFTQFYLLPRYKETVAIIQLKQSVSKSPNITSNDDSTADWKTYTNRKYAFSIKYPSTMDLQEKYDQQTAIFGNQISLLSRPFGGIFLAGLCSGGGSNLISEENIKITVLDIKKTVGTHGGVDMNRTYCPPQTYVEYFFEKRIGNTRNTYIFQLNELSLFNNYDLDKKQYPLNRIPQKIDQEKVKIFEQMFSTFKFLPQKPFASENECEEKTGTTCSFSTCDYIPLGKTIEEVCGDRPSKGWYPIQ